MSKRGKREKKEVVGSTIISEDSGVRDQAPMVGNTEQDNSICNRETVGTPKVSNMEKGRVQISRTPVKREAGPLNDAVILHPKLWA